MALIISNVNILIFHYQTWVLQFAALEKSLHLGSEKINCAGNTIVPLLYFVVLVWDLYPNLHFFIPFWKMFYTESFELLVLFVFYLKC